MQSLSAGFGTLGTGESVGIGLIIWSASTRAGVDGTRHCDELLCVGYCEDGRVGTFGTEGDGMFVVVGTFGTRKSPAAEVRELASWWTKRSLRGSKIMDEVLCGWLNVSERGR